MTLRKFRAELAKHGFTADINYIARSGDYDVIVDTPIGKCYEPGLHCLVHHTLTGDTEEERARVRDEALCDALDHLPLEDCTDPECDVCRPLEDVAAPAPDGSDEKVKP
jgi:hypothetical protein